MAIINLFGFIGRILCCKFCLFIPLTPIQKMYPCCPMSVSLMSLYCSTKFHFCISESYFASKVRDIQIISNSLLYQVLHVSLHKTLTNDVKIFPGNTFKIGIGLSWGIHNSSNHKMSPVLLPPTVYKYFSCPKFLPTVGFIQLSNVHL